MVLPHITGLFDTLHKSGANGDYYTFNGAVTILVALAAQPKLHPVLFDFKNDTYNALNIAIQLLERQPVEVRPFFSLKKIQLYHYKVPCAALDTINTHSFPLLYSQTSTFKMAQG